MLNPTVLESVLTNGIEPFWKGYSLEIGEILERGMLDVETVVGHPDLF